jgi:hypothetical protein
MPLLINTVDYGDNWLWPDEFEWDPVAQATEQTLTGALVVEEHTRLAGRPLTFSGSWLTRAQVDALAVLRDIGGELSITWRGVTYAVAWRHADTAIDARQVWDAAEPAAGDLYDVTLRFIEV